MRRSRVLLRVCALGLGVAVALAPMTVAAAKTKAPTGTNRGSAFCKLLTSQESVGEKYSTKIESAFQSGNLAAARAAILSEFSYGVEYVDKALAAGKVPASVQTALKYFVNLYGREKTAVKKARTLAAMETALEALSKAPKFETENTTVSQFVATECGSLTATT
jgi:hypothetical protein